MSAERKAVLGLILVAGVLSMPGCSMANREGPLVTCEDLEYGQVNACKEGIIARCEAGVVAYEVCEDDVGDDAARNLCDATWQVPGSYSCEPPPDSAPY